MTGVVLEVAVSDPRDVAGAAEGGADRLHLAVPGPTCGLSPEPALVSAVCHESDLPVFVLLRLNDTWSTTGGEFARLVGLAEDYLALRGHGRRVRLPRRRPRDRHRDLHDAARPAARRCPWTFTRAIDSSLDPRRSWRRLLPCRGWSPCAPRARRAACPSGTTTCWPSITPEIAPLVMPGGGLAAEHVPWLLQAGVRAAPPRRPGPARRVGEGVRRRRLRPVVALAGRRPARRTRTDDPHRPAARARRAAGCGPTSPATRRTTSCTSSRAASASRSVASTATTTTYRPSSTTTRSPPARCRSARASWSRRWCGPGCDDASDSTLLEED